MQRAKNFVCVNKLNQMKMNLILTQIIYNTTKVCRQTSLNASRVQP